MECKSNGTVTGLFVCLFLMFIIFKVIICYNIASVLCFGFLAIDHVGSTALEGEILNIGPPRKSYRFAFTRDLHIKYPPARSLSWENESWRKHSIDLEHGPSTVRDSLAISGAFMKLNG